MTPLLDKPTRVDPLRRAGRDWDDRDSSVGPDRDDHRVWMEGRDPDGRDDPDRVSLDRADRDDPVDRVNLGRADRDDPDDPVNLADRDDPVNPDPADQWMGDLGWVVASSTPS
jgi:hypothetical protein